MTAVLDVPADWRFIGYFCLGYPLHEDDRPELERALERDEGILRPQPPASAMREAKRPVHIEKRSTPTSNASDSIGTLGTATRVAARVTKPAPVTPLAPLEVIIAIRSTPI